MLKTFLVETYNGENLESHHIYVTAHKVVRSSEFVNRIVVDNAIFVDFETDVLEITEVKS